MKDVRAVVILAFCCSQMLVTGQKQQDSVRHSDLLSGSYTGFDNNFDVG